MTRGLTNLIAELRAVQSQWRIDSQRGLRDLGAHVQSQATTNRIAALANGNAAQVFIQWCDEKSW